MPAMETGRTCPCPTRSPLGDAPTRRPADTPCGDKSIQREGGAADRCEYKVRGLLAVSAAAHSQHGQLAVDCQPDMTCLAAST
jgi:hypothetical protein